MDPDNYYGDKATDYEAKRVNGPEWEIEQRAVEAFVNCGPVLDVPCGTGRYFPVYAAKGIEDVTGIDISSDMLDIAKSRSSVTTRLMRGSVKDLHNIFPSQSFRAVVCSRLLNWFYPDDMALAVRNLSYVAREVIVSIRTGIPGRQPRNGNYTHSHNDWLFSLQGLYIRDKRHILTTPEGEFYFYHLTIPTWQDVVDRFAWHKDGPNAINRLSADWFAMLGLRQSDFSIVRVTCENYTGAALGRLLDKLAAVHRIDGKSNAMVTDERPLNESGPIVLVRSQGREFMIDGRRRANLWRNRPGDLFQCLIVSV